MPTLLKPLSSEVTSKIVIYKVVDALKLNASGYREKRCAKTSGFTLIEMSMVLVIIGLIVGSILAGQDLISAAAQRAQITQIEKYNAAVRTFQNKYGGLPGDLADPVASQFGFQARGTNDGDGDGDGVLKGNCGDVPGGSSGIKTGCGELAVFWQDLSTSGLIDASIPTGANGPQTTGNGGGSLTQQQKIADWLPAGKIGNGTSVYVYSIRNTNYFSVSTVTLLGSSIDSNINPGITVQQAYNIDKKIDDGLPQSGNVSACYINYYVVNLEPVWAAGGGGTIEGASGGSNCKSTTTGTIPLPTDCYGNNDTAGTMQYSISTNASSQNCALSFKFQ